MRFIAVLLLAAPLCSAQQPATLRQYLGLTDQQVASINQLDADYDTYLQSKDSRIRAVNGELAQIYAQPSPDQYQLGIRYVELEAIRRDEANHVAALQTQIAAQLTPAQTMQVQALTRDITLQSLVGDAACAFLVDRPQYEFSYLMPYPGTYGNLPGFVSAPLYVSITGSLLSVQYPFFPPALAGTFCGSTTFPISVRQYLSLTDPQVAAFVNASDAYNDYYARRQNRMSAVYAEIRDQTAAPTPDPLALGQRYYELFAIGQDITKQRLALGQTARSVLTPSQNAALQPVQDAANATPLIAQALGCHLTSVPPGATYGFFGFSSISIPTPEMVTGGFSQALPVILGCLQ